MKHISVGDLKNVLSGGAVLIDVRGAGEYNYEHIAEARNIPRSELEKADLPKDKEIYVICQIGMSSMAAARKLEGLGFKDVVNVTGGIEAWKMAQYPVERAANVRCVIPIMRQVQIIAGSMVLLGSFFIELRWLAFLAGAGLLFAGISGTCMMAGLLSRMPWNR